MKNRDNMIIIQNHKFLVKCLGLEPFRISNVKNNLNAFCYLPLIPLHAGMAVGYLILNIDDMKSATSSAIVPMGCVVTLTYVLYFLLNFDRITSLEKDLQDIVDESK